MTVPLWIIAVSTLVIAVMNIIDHLMTRKMLAEAAMEIDPDDLMRWSAALLRCNVCRFEGVRAVIEGDELDESELECPRCKAHDAEVVKYYDHDEYTDMAQSWFRVRNGDADESSDGEVYIPDEW